MCASQDFIPWSEALGRSIKRKTRGFFCLWRANWARQNIIHWKERYEKRSQSPKQLLCKTFNQQLVHSCVSDVSRNKFFFWRSRGFSFDLVTVWGLWILFQDHNWEDIPTLPVHCLIYVWTHHTVCDSHWSGLDLVSTHSGLDRDSVSVLGGLDCSTGIRQMNVWLAVKLIDQHANIC